MVTKNGEKFDLRVFAKVKTKLLFQMLKYIYSFFFIFDKLLISLEKTFCAKIFRNWGHVCSLLDNPGCHRELTHFKISSHS